jgi:scyllo-inositol 2-dehydrogenase (NADP+)
LTVAVGLIGYGLGGSVFHAPLVAAASRLRLAAVATSRTVEVGEGTRIVATAAELIADARIDLVVISTPHASHFPLARDALGAGKHVVIDKPFALTSAEAEELIGLARDESRVLVPFHNRRWDGDYLTIRQFLLGGRLGELCRFEAHWDRFRPVPREGWKEVPEEGAGLLNDLGPHLVDQALQLFGWPAMLQADIGIQRPDGRVDEYFEIILFYGARRVILGSTLLGAAERPRFALHGTGGSLIRYGLDPQEAALKEGMRPDAAGFGADSPASDAIFTNGAGEEERIPTLPGRYLSFYEEVADAIIDRAAPPVDPTDARDGLRLMELARESARDGRRIATGDRRISPSA